MYPERESPYWQAIVGENWPQISPHEWGRLEALARDGAMALDPDEAERARRAFDDRVRISAGLQPIKDQLLAQQRSLRGFVDALVAAADTFGRISALVNRARDRILNIVGDADRRIRAAIQHAENENDTADEPPADAESDAAVLRRRIGDIVAGARAEVSEVVADALRQLGPQGLPELALIAAALGRPNPWASGPEGGPGSGGRSRHPGGHRHLPAHAREFRALPHGPWPAGDAFVPEIPALEGVRDLLRHLLPQLLPLSRLPGWEALEPDLLAPVGAAPVTDTTVGTPEIESPLVTPGSGGLAPVTVPGGAPSATAHDAGHGLTAGTGAIAAVGGPTSRAHTPGPPMAGTGESHSGDLPSEQDEQPSRHGPAPETSPVPGATRTVGADDSTRTDPDTPSGVVSHVGSGRDGIAASPAATGRSDEGSDIAGAAGPIPFGAAAQPAVFVPAPTQHPGVPPAQVSAAGTAAPELRGSQTGGETRNATTVSRNPAASGSAAVAPAGVSAPAGVTPPGAPGKGQPPVRPAIESPGTAETESHDGNDGGSGDLIRDAVGAAMAASAAPAFVLGRRVDGDLVLARSLLQSLMAADRFDSVGTAYAVSIMRHDGGITAFVTSNDGRGRLPPGVFLPRELSTPWTWSVAEGTTWEGIDDPTRILAEFALAWGKQTGARLSALVSSVVIGELLVRQLGEVAVEGQVQPYPAMDFSVAAPGLVDRLELVGSPRLLERVASIPADRIGSRGFDFAYDAHLRLGKAGPNPLASLGTTEVRHRILQTILRGGVVSAQWWEELRDADQLLAASMLPMASDVSRIPLGELRNDTSSGRSHTDAVILRLLVAERRCDEMVLLMSGEPSRQRLRDIVYAHGMVSEFLATLPVTTETAEPARRPTITTGPR